MAKKSLLSLSAVVFMIFFYLSDCTGVSALADDNVEFAFMDYWRLEVPDNVLYGENYTVWKGINFGLCKMDDTSGNPELKMSFRPENESQISDIMNLDKIGGVYSTGWNTFEGKDNCFGGDVWYNMQQSGASPVVVIRKVDRIFFDSRGIQRCTVDVTPLHQLNRLEVEFEIGYKEDAEIKVLSPYGEVSDSGDMVRFYVDNPTKGASHSFTLELEITPRKSQASFKPAVWVSADMTRIKDPIRHGKLFEYETGYGDFIIESNEDVFLHLSRHERFNVWMQGISTSAKLVMPDIQGGSPMGIELTNEMLLIVLAVVLAVIILAASELLYRKLKSKPQAKRPDEQLRGLEDEEKKIRGMKKNVQREYFKGLITSQAFNKMTMEYEEKLMGIISKKDDLRKKLAAKKSPQKSPPAGK